jgi:hypothetical protein
VKYETVTGRSEMNRLLARMFGTLQRSWTDDVREAERDAATPYARIQNLGWVRVVVN